MESSIGLAHVIARGYPSLDFDDAVQEAMLGFMIAATKYRPEISQWSTYAAIWARQRCWRAIQNTTGCVRTPVHAWHTRELSAEHPLRMGDPVSTDGRRTVAEIIPSDDSGPEQRAMAAELLDAIEALPSRLGFVVARRWLLGSTLEEIGLEMEVTRERVRQLEAQALQLLRKRLVRTTPTGRYDD